MSKWLTTSLQRHALWLSILLHLLGLLSAGIIVSFNSTPPIQLQKKPGLYIPAYTLSSPSTSHQSPSTMASSSPYGIEKPQLNGASSTDNEAVAKTATKKTDPVHLIGDKKIDNKLIKLLAQAITVHLRYPAIARDLEIKGTAVIRFRVYPDGHVDQITLVKSSSADVLDQAALTAIKAMLPPMQISQYLHKPENIEFGIIFN